MSSLFKVGHRTGVFAMCSGVLIAGGIGAGCTDMASDDEPVAFSSSEQGLTPAVVAGDPLPGITAANFATAKTHFQTVEALDDGLGPVFNERACGNCHTQGAIGGAGVQIERRFGRFDNGIFNSLPNEGDRCASS